MVRIALGQIDTTVGDLEGNVAAMAEWTARATDMGADIVCFPELAITGYPPEDLVLRPEFVDDNLEALERLAKLTAGGCAVLTGFVDLTERGRHNAAALLKDGRVVERYHKIKLPNYGVFDEQRTFVPGSEACSVRLGDSSLGISVCEDAWAPGPPFDAYVRERIPVILNINGSPYHRRKSGERLQIAADLARGARGRLPSAPARPRRLRPEERVPGGRGGALGRDRLRPRRHARHRRPRRRGRPRRRDAVAVHLDRQCRGRRRGCPTPRCPPRRALDRGRRRRLPGGPRRALPRHRGGDRRGEPPGPDPGHPADGAVEQVRLARPRDREQERVCGGLRHAVRRHGRRVRADQGRPEDPRLRARALAERPGTEPPDPRPGAREGSHGRAPSGPEGHRLAAAVRGPRPRDRGVRRTRPFAARDRR